MAPGRGAVRTHCHQYAPAWAAGRHEYPGAAGPGRAASGPVAALPAAGRGLPSGQPAAGAQHLRKRRPTGQSRSRQRRAGRQYARMGGGCGAGSARRRSGRPLARAGQFRMVASSTGGGRRKRDVCTARSLFRGPVASPCPCLTVPSGGDGKTGARHQPVRAGRKAAAGPGSGRVDLVRLRALGPG